MSLKKFVDLQLIIFQKINIFGLDAPLVILFWNGIIEHEFNLQISYAIKLTLFLSVWLAYSADRFLDENNFYLKKKLEARHLIFKKNPLKFFIVWIILFVCAVTLTIVYFVEAEIYFSLLLLVLVLSNQGFSLFENKKLNKTILKPFRTSMILTIGCFIYPYLHLEYYDYSLLFFPFILCITFLANCVAVTNLKSAYFDKSHSFLKIVKGKITFFCFVLPCVFFIELSPFVTASFLSISSIPLIVFNSKVSYDDRRVVLDQVFWIIPLLVYFSFFDCEF